MRLSYAAAAIHSSDELLVVAVVVDTAEKEPVTFRGEREGSNICTIEQTPYLYVPTRLFVSRARRAGHAIPPAERVFHPGPWHTADGVRSC